MRRILIIPVLSLMAVFFVAGPASAATVDEFTVDGEASATITAGESAEVVWAATIADEGNVALTSAPTVPGFDDPNADASGTTTVTPTEPGTYTFTITANDSDVPPVDTATVTLEVVETEGPTVVDPEPVTFPEPCTVVLPEQEGVEYGVSFGGFGDSLDPGEYDLAEFYNFDEAVTFFMNPADGFAFPDDTQTAFEVVPSEDCFPQFVTAEGVCQGVEFTNTTDGTLVVLYGDIEEDEPDGELELAAGSSRTVSTDRDLVFYIAGESLDADEAVQAGLVEVEQDCVPASAGASHPTVAPAAGSGGGTDTGLLAGAALAAVAVLGAGTLGARRLQLAA